MALRTATKRPSRRATRIQAEVAVLIMVAAWVYCIKVCHQEEWSIISKDAAISQSAIHSYCSFNQEWLSRTPADAIGRHHNRKKLNSEHATREAFMA